MEPNSVDLDTAAKGLALLALVPVIVFSLWTDYIERTQVDPEEENPIPKIRVVSFIILLFEAILFLEASDIRGRFPIYTQLNFIGVIFLQLLSQNLTERKLKKLYAVEGEGKPSSPPTEENALAQNLIRSAIRLGLLWIVGGSLYLLFVASLVRFSLFLAQSLHLSMVLSTASCILGGAAGILLGLLLNLILSPIYLKFIFPVKPLTPPETRARLEKCFNQRQIAPQLWLIDIKNIQITDFIFTGISNPFSPVKSGVFISHMLLELLDVRELEALALVQVSHAALNHTRKRFFFSFLLILFSISFAITFMFINHLSFSGKLIVEALLVTVTFLSLSLSFRLVSAQIKRHEIEADIHSIENLNGNLWALTSALKKLHQQNLAQYPQNTELSIRIDALRDHFRSQLDTAPFNAKAS